MELPVIQEEGGEEDDFSGGGSQKGEENGGKGRAQRLHGEEAHEECHSHTLEP